MDDLLKNFGTIHRGIMLMRGGLNKLEDEIKADDWEKLCSAYIICENSLINAEFAIEGIIEYLKTKNSI